MRRGSALVPAALLCVAALAGGAVAPAAAQSAPTTTVFDGSGAVLNVLPPGSRGNVGIADALAIGPSRTATGTHHPGELRRPARDVRRDQHQGAGPDR